VSEAEAAPSVHPAKRTTSIFPVALGRVLGRPRVLPGLLPTLGFTWIYLGVLVLLPVSALFLRASSLGLGEIVNVISAPRTAASLQLSFGASLGAAVINTLSGTLVAWVLARYKFIGRSLLDAVVDVPFALPTSVAGIALTYVYSPKGVIGAYFSELGMPIAFTRAGIVVALTFVGMPFVVRTVQPVIQELDVGLEEAASSLGATQFQTFYRVILPTIVPAIATGFALSFARAVGEYGSVLFIAGNMPLKTEIAPLLIVTKLEQFDYAGAAVIGGAMLLSSLLILFSVQVFERAVFRKIGGEKA
jgi:sulfate transport system permease protein